MTKLSIFLFKLWYGLSLFSLTIYSYTQIDLNLTLSSHPLYQSIQNQLIFIGIYQRPFSAYILTFLLLILFFNYFIILKSLYFRIFKLPDVIHLIAITIVILLFSYPAFSYDLFNYIFDARILANYHLNPYEYKALDFPGDHWTRFMHWTHRTYPYGPVWLFLTLPVYFLGFGKFVLTLLNFKLLFSVGYILSAYLIYTILKLLKSKNALFETAFFALNPLIIIETLVSPHNEIWMLALLLISLYLLLSKKKLPAYITLALSGGIKYLTFTLLPLYYLFIKKKINPHSLVKITLLALSLLLVPLIALREAYPWYFITILGLSSLIDKSRFPRLLIIAISAALLSRYLPFIYFGDYSALEMSWQNILPFFVLLFTLSLYFLKSKRLFPL